MKSVGNYGSVDGSNGELSPSINRLKSQISFSSRSASSLGMLSQISELGSEDIEATSSDDGRQGGSNGPGFPYASWNDTPPSFSENLSSGLKRGRSGNEKMFSDVQVYTYIYRMLTSLIILAFLFSLLILNTNKLFCSEWRARKSSSYIISSLEFTKNFS